MKYVALAILLTTASATAATDALYVADPANGMIYARNLAEGPGALRPVSGSVSIMANQADFLSSSELVYQPLGQQDLYTFNLLHNRTEPLADLADGEVVLDMSAGPGPNSFVLLMRTGSTRFLRMYDRGNAEADWAHQDHPLPNQLFREVVRLDTGDVNTTATFALAGGAGDELFSYSAGGIPTLVETLPSAFLPVRGPEGRLAALGSAAEAPTYQLIDGAMVKQGALATDGLLKAADWKSGSPAFAAVSASGELLVGEDPMNTAPQSVHSSRDSEGRIVPGMNITGAVQIENVGPGVWRLFDTVSGSVRTLDVNNNTLTPHMRFQVGRGPDFQWIQDIAITPAGEIYVLDDSSRIIQVDSRVGNRTIVMDFGEERRLTDYLESDDEGRLLLLEWIPGNQMRLLRLDSSATPPSLEEGTPFPAPNSLRDVKWGGGALVVTGDPIASSPLLRVTMEGASTHGDFSYTTNTVGLEPGEVFSDSFHADIEVPSSFGANPSVVRLHADLGDYHWNQGFHDIQLFAPDGTEVSLNPSNYLTTRASLEGLSSPIPGVWRVKFNAGQVFADDLPEATVTLTFQVAPRAYHIAAVPSADSAVVFTGFPATLTDLELSSGVATDTTIAASSDEVNRLADIIPNAEGDGYFAAGRQEPVIYLFDGSTGVAELWSEGRPAPLNEAGLSTESISPLRIALGPPTGQPVFTGFVILGN